MLSSKSGDPKNTPSTTVQDLDTNETLRWPSFPEKVTPSAPWPGGLRCRRQGDPPQTQCAGAGAGVYLGAAESGGTYPADRRQGRLPRPRPRPSSTKLSVIWVSPTKLPATAVRRAQSVIDSLGIDPSTVTEPATSMPKTTRGEDHGLSASRTARRRASARRAVKPIPGGLRMTTKLRYPQGCGGRLGGFPSPEPLVLACPPQASH